MKRCGSIPVFPNGVVVLAVTFTSALFTVCFVAGYIVARF